VTDFELLKKVAENKSKKASNMFRVEEFPGVLKEVTLKDDGNEIKGKATFEFGDAEWDIKVTVKPKFEDEIDQFFAGIPYKITLVPMIRQLPTEEEDEGPTEEEDEGSE